MGEELRDIVVDDEEAVKYVHKGVNERGIGIEPEEIALVIDLHYEYLDSIGLVERE